MRLVMAGRVASIGCALLLVSVSLTACDTALYDGPASLRATPSGLEVTVCINLELNSGEAAEKNADADSWADFWSASGRLSLNRGDSFSIPSRDALMVDSAFKRPNLQEGDEVVMSLEGLEPSGENGGMLLSFLIAPEGLSSTAWLGTDGRETKDPCEGWP